MSRAGRFSKAGLREFWWEAVRTWLWPPLITVGATMIGYLQGVPIFYLCVGSAAIFSFVVTALLRYTEWREHRRVEWKISIHGPLFTLDNRTRLPIMGVQVSNSAAFPIECEYTEIESRIIDRVTKKQHRPCRMTIHPGNTGWYYDHPIEVELPKGDEVLEGHIRYRVIYGLPGKELKYSLEGKKEVLIRRTAQGADVATWNDVRQDNA